MSIVLKDGTVLPDIPADVLASYPYFTILFSEEDKEYIFIATKDKQIYEQSSSEISTASGGFSAYAYYEGAWIHAATDEQAFTLPASAYEGSVIVYANHDVLYANSTEIYFPNSIPPFVLPDGTELPALPEGCFEKYPYGVIMWLEGTGNAEGNNMYFIFTTSSNSYHIPVGVGTETYEQLGFGGSKGFEQYAFGGTLTDWTLVASSTETIENFPLGDYGDPNARLWLKWSNHDILTATAKNDDGTYTVGSEIYHRSDVNYRIYGGWMNSMGNQARRLGNVSGALKPGEMETVFKGVSGAGVEVTVTEVSV